MTTIASKYTPEMVPNMSTIELRFAIKQLAGAETKTRNTAGMRKRVLALLAAGSAVSSEAPKQEAPAPAASRITNDLPAATPAPALARRPAKAKPAAAAKPVKAKPKFEHDHRVLAIYKIGEHIEKRDGDGKLLARVEIVKDGFAWRGETYESLSPIAKEVSGTAQSGLVYFGVIPYNDRDRKGKTTAELAKDFDKALALYNAAAHQLGLGRIMGGGLAALEVIEDHDAAREAVGSLRLFIEALGGSIRAIALGINLLEVRHGRADDKAAA